ncbi:MAG: Acetyl-coenzyme A carboxylase carboxyl transferase subunit alpha [Chlamydiia bacterium]|nr:Acetyl-coenzyme A carboxylase carboxyl transferase subunit alpha [Chlamydiia bacterium]
MNMLDHEKQIYEYEKTLKQLKEQNEENTIWSDDEIQKLEKKLDDLKKNVYSKLSSWERIMICRHPERPKSLDYIKHICSEFEEIHGDRLYRDDHAVIAGFAMIEDQKFMVIAQEKGSDTESRLYRNFGMMYPEGYRKALRVMKLAEKFNLPVLTIIDTPGAYPGLEAEERGQGWAIATNLWEMAAIKTPILSLLIGEGCSGGALGIGVSDDIVMLEHAYYSVISPEGCASILWKDAASKDKAAEALKLHAEDLKKLDIVDSIIDEPLGGAHHEPNSVYEKVKTYLVEKCSELKKIDTKTLTENRYNKYRKIGRYLEEAK